MKRLFKAVIAVAMAVCLVCCAFATPGISPTATVDLGTAIGASGEPVKVTESPATEVPTDTEVVEVLKEVAPEGTKAEDLSVVYSMDLSVPAEELPVTITFTVSGAKANDDVYVLHYNGTSWEVVATGKGSSIDATFTSLSPVAVVLQPVEKPYAPENSAAPEASAAPEVSAAPETSAAPEASAAPEVSAAPEASALPEATTPPEDNTPQTGDNMTMLYAGVAMFVSAGAIVLLARKKNA